MTSASANIRRAALASAVRVASRRNCAAVSSVRVIATAAISPPSESKRQENHASSRPEIPPSQNQMPLVSDAA
jgi:hypothetical protein